MSSSTKDIKNINNSSCSKCNSTPVLYYANTNKPYVHEKYPHLCNTCAKRIPSDLRNEFYIQIR